MPLCVADTTVMLQTQWPEFPSQLAVRFSARGHQSCVTLQFWLMSLWHVISHGVWELGKASVLHTLSCLTLFVLSYRLIVVAAVYQSKFVLALSIMTQVLKQALIPLDLQVVTEICCSRGCLP